MKTSRSLRWLIGSVAAVTLCGTATLQAEVDVRVLESAPDRIVLHYTFDAPTQDAVDIDGVKHLALSVAGEAVTKEVGAPAVPLVARSLIVGDIGVVSLNILDAEYQDVASAPVAPSKGFILRTIDPATVPYEFGPVYDQDAFYPDAAALRTPFIQRDYRGVTVLTHPAQYNPVRGVLRVYSSLTVEVLTKGTGGINELDRSTRSGKVGPSFDMIYRHRFLNYGQAGRYDPLDEEGDMLIICHDAWLGNAQPLADHRSARGIPTTLVGVSTAGGDATAIKNYIQGVYDSSDLAFVLLVGDAAQVPSPYASGGASDPTYSKLAGGDDYPEIMVGRLSAENADQVDTQVERTIEYENMPAPLMDWFWKGVGIASSQGAGIGDEGQADYVHMGEIREWLLAFGYTEVDEFYDPGATASQVSAALNEGRGIINYCGHGSPTSWGTTGFSSSDVNNLVNDNMLPFVTSVACNTGQFDSYTCLGEAFLRATNGGEPTGGIAFYGSTISQSWAPPMEAQDEFNLLYTAEAYVSFGALCFAGSCSMMDDYGAGGVTEFNAWTILGDPALRVAITCTSQGTLMLDRGEYACVDTANLLVTDCDLNLDDEVADTVTVNVASDTAPAGVDVLLTELGPASGQFAGTVELGGAGLPISAGDTIVATYIDEDDGEGLEVIVTAGAIIDCTGPSIDGIQVIEIEPRSATVQFTTDEPAMGVISYGLSCGELEETAYGGGYSTTPTVTLGSLDDDTTYWFMVTAIDEAGNYTQDPDCYTFTTPEVPDFFTEEFTSGFDLGWQMLTFTPNGTVDFYDACVEPIEALPTDPEGGTTIGLSDDDYQSVSVSGGQVSLYGVDYSSVYVGSNGYLTFGGSDSDYTESLDDHFDLPRISALFDDLNPSTGGSVSYMSLLDRFVVTYEEVPEYSAEGANTFQIELYFDGVITISYAELSCQDAIVGLSEGAGLSPDYFDMDLSELGDCILLGDLNCSGVVDFFDVGPFVLAITEPATYATQYPDCDIMGGDCNGDGAVDFFDIEMFVEMVIGS